jgi:penicillin amidase
MTSRNETIGALISVVTALCLVACGEDSGPAAAPSDVATSADFNGEITDAGSSPGEVDGGAGTTAPEAPLLEIDESESFVLEGLSADVHVIRTEMGVPHIYAENRNDLGRALGFLLGRDRFFVMDLQRRLGLGTISELLGASALENDMEARGTGVRFVAERLEASASPEMKSYVNAFIGGLNAYVAGVAAGDLEAPSELKLAAPLLGAPNPADLMEPWTPLDVASMVAVIMYETTYESGDVGRTAKLAGLADLYAGEGPAHDLRREGFLTDITHDVRALFEAHSSAGLGLETSEGLTPGPKPSAGQQPSGKPAKQLAEQTMMERLSKRLERFQLRIQRDQRAGYGSNAWAVAGTHTTDGSSLVAGDGHLQLSIPPLFYQVGMDTELLGDGDIAQLGMLMTGLPVLAVGTNGKVAWSQVNPVIDITDWYREEITLDAQGAPAFSIFGDEPHALASMVEEFVVADIPALGSEGRTETWARWTTFDGRWIADVEGHPATEETALEAGQTLVNMMGSLVIPADIDGDGVITAISFDYAALDATNYLDALDQLGKVDNVEEFRQATRGIVGSGLFSAAGDNQGNILFSSYQGVPCRGYLPRTDSGEWEAGADPRFLLDGTLFGGFTIPMKDGVADESQGAGDPQSCVVPFDAMPQAVNPAQGYVFTANNDPGHITESGSVSDDDWYIGGPWSSVRAHTIARELEGHVTAGTADVVAMSETQGNHDSRLGEVFAPYFIEAITKASQSASDPGGTPEVMRLAALYGADSVALDNVAERLSAWLEAGAPAESGVETFYHAPHSGDLEHAVATMIFNAAFSRLLAQVFNDEPLGDVWIYSSSRMKVRALRKFLDGRGPENLTGLASWDVSTGESAFFDVYATPEQERSDELLIASMTDALTFLRGEPEAPGVGGFGSDDMSSWLWGLRHQARFESLLAAFLAGDASFGFLVDLFSVTTEQLPLAENMSPEDPRVGLKWFPRPGDQWCVDAANPGFSGTAFTHANGPVMRMVIALKGDEVSGVNILPGGQSGLTDSANFADQLELWLANQTIPLRYHLDDVIAGAVSRERLSPAGQGAQE